MSKHKTNAMPYIRTVAGSLAFAWGLTLITWSKFIDMLIEALVVYSGKAAPVANHILMAAVILTVAIVVGMVYREIRNERKLLEDHKDIKQEQIELDQLVTEYQA